jgi:hypothetical protein
MPNKSAAIIAVQDLNSISPAEAVSKAKEDMLEQASGHRVPDQAILEDQAMAKQAGYWLDYQELVRRISLLNPRILFQKGGVTNAIAVRYPKRDEHGEVVQEYVTGFYCESLPEYSSVTLDEKGLPHREIRGWRSVLVALIRAGALTKKQCDAIFGPAMGERSMLWYRHLQNNQ